MADVDFTVLGPGGPVKWARDDLTRMGSDGGVRFGDLVGPIGDATHVTFETESSDYRASIPIEIATASAVVHVGDHGLRLDVEAGRTLCWNVKDLARARLTVGPEADSVPENPPH